MGVEIKETDPSLIKRFVSYCDYTKKIVLDLPSIHQQVYELNTCNLSFLFWNLINVGRDKPGKTDNLLHPNILSLFRNLDCVEINTYYGNYLQAGNKVTVASDLKE